MPVQLTLYLFCLFRWVLSIYIEVSDSMILTNRHRAHNWHFTHSIYRQNKLGTESKFTCVDITLPLFIFNRLQVTHELKLKFSIADFSDASYAHEKLILQIWICNETKEIVLDLSASAAWVLSFVWMDESKKWKRNKWIH